jgi:Fic family protein
MALTLKDLLAEADALKKEIDALRPLPRDVEGRIWEKFRLEWTFHSNAIEGNQLSLGETRTFLLEGLTAKGKPLKDYLDIQGHQHVVNYLLDFIRGREQVFTEADIRALHTMLLQKPYEVQAQTPEGKPTTKTIKLGEYKSEPNQVTTPTGEVKRFALPEETPARMAELMTWWREEENKAELHPVMIAAMVHHQFVSIHPFDDGNGRMARLLMNLILMQHGFPPVIIKVTERDLYFLELSRADAGDIESFTRFIAGKLLTSMAIYLKGAKGESIAEYDDIDKKIDLLKRELQQIPDPKPYSIAVYREFLNGTVRNLLTKVLQKLNKFDDFFLESNATVLVNHSGSSVSKALEDLIARAQQDRPPQSLEYQFWWQNFKKAGARSFGYNVNIKFHFSAMYFTLELNTGERRDVSYDVGLSEEDCKEIASSLAERFFDLIQRNRGVDQKK